jgi:hypothetical protein
MLRPMLIIVIKTALHNIYEEERMLQKNSLTGHAAELHA